MNGANIEFSTSTVLFDFIKIRKRVDILPIRVEVGLDWNRVTREQFPYVSVRDRIFRGDINLEPHTHNGTMAVYRKNLSLPTGRVNIRAGVALKGFKGHAWSPFVGFGYGFNANNTSAQITDQGIDFRVRVPVMPRRLKFEVCGNAKVPMPAAQYEAGTEGGSLMLGEGGFALNIAQLNPIIYV